MENNNMENNEVNFWGALLDDKPLHTDFRLSGLSDYTLDNFLKNAKADNVVNFYNQAKIKDSKPYNDTRWSCVLFGNYGAIGDVTGHKFTDTELLELQKDAVDNYGLKVPGGMWISRGVEVARRMWNKNHPENEVVSFRLDLLKENDVEILQKLYNIGKTIVCWYKTTREHFKDAQDNGVLDGSSFIGSGNKQLSWHCVRHNRKNNIDNYNGVLPYNIYVNEHLVPLVKDKTYFRHVYVYFKKNELKEIFPDVLENAPHSAGISWVKENGIMNGDANGNFNPSAGLTRAEFATSLKNYHQKKDNIK